MHWMTATEIRAAYAKRALSPVELVQALLGQIARHDSKCHAFVNLDADAALQEARIAEKALFSGCGKGLLHGVPVALKDNIDIQGQPTTCHSKILLDKVAAQDAAATRSLRESGAILFGKTALHEFAIGGPSVDLPFPPARNPWNPDHHPGGSSSGSGAALAAGFVPIALGTDTGGSIRHPAAACGVVGLKPTYDLVPRTGVFPLAFTLDHVGPMARCVADVALALDAMASPVKAACSSFGEGLASGVRGLRVGFVRHFHEEDMKADAQVIAALDEAAKVLAQEGAEICEVRLPRLQDFAGLQRVVLLAESWAIHAGWLRNRPEDYGAISRRKLMSGAFVSAEHHIHAQQNRMRMIEAVENALRDVDVLLTVNAMDPPCRMDDDDALLHTYRRQARAPFNITGHPALAMMCGLSANGLPLSMQLVGGMYDEATVLRVAAAYERATQWHLMRAPNF